jgi:ring-1,2-phenylacetyl-CoA epoxidase subunit PaaC
LWLGLAAEVEGAGRDADALAFRRDVWDFRNLLLVEQPNGDYGQTMMRQFLFDGWHLAMLKGLSGSNHDQIAAIAEKSVKEVTYHLERSSDTVIGLGDGTEESRNRMQAALDKLWPYAGEMFVRDAVDAAMVGQGIAPDPASLRDGFDLMLSEVLEAATLIKPEDDFAHKGGKNGVRHTEHLGHLLTQMQWLQRAYPDATW